MHDGALSMTCRPGDQLCACAEPIGAGMAEGLPIAISYQHRTCAPLNYHFLPCHPSLLILYLHPHSPHSLTIGKCPATTLPAPALPLGCRDLAFSLLLSAALFLVPRTLAGLCGSHAFPVHSLNKRQALLGSSFLQGLIRNK